MASAVNGLRSLCTWRAPNEISVLPVPHSAMTAAPRASFQRFTTPMIASVCAGKGLRRSCPIRGEGTSLKPCRGGKVRRMRSPSSEAHARRYAPIESMSFGTGIAFSSWFVQSTQKSDGSEELQAVAGGRADEMKALGMSAVVT